MVGLCLQDGERRWGRGPSVPMTGDIWWGTTSINAAFATGGSGSILGDPCVRGRGNHVQGESPQLDTLTVDLPEPHGPPQRPWQGRNHEAPSRRETVGLVCLA